MNKEEVVNLANECGADFRTVWPSMILDADELLAFANACEKIGMEKAAEAIREEIK